jgi:hypothetical protein
LSHDAIRDKSPFAISARNMKLRHSS